ncbi:MAG: DUF1905 domain-containing protein [Bryobacterales bacterium]|nr:DUF1905 domain-containing protein [Bryobacterales bacterium]
MDFEVSFEARLWRHDGQAAWYFLTLPREVSARVLAEAEGRMKPGGSVPVSASIGRTRWNTSLFRDLGRGAFLLPVKAAVREKEQLREGDAVEVVLVNGRR